MTASGNNNNNKNQPFHITVTVIWDAHALNRDEKAGGNILSIKKLSKNGKTYSFIGKPAIRHYLWETLRRTNTGEEWFPADTISAQGEGNQSVIQFDLFKHNILTRAELDLFGYMFTPLRLTRKAPVGITKAIALEEWYGNMAFYANHGLVARLRHQGEEAEPNIYQKEEHTTSYLCSFTIDVAKVGQDIWVVPEQVKLTSIPDRYRPNSKSGNKDKKINIAIEENDIRLSLKIGNKKREIPVRAALSNGTQLGEIVPNKQEHKIEFLLDSGEQALRILAVLRALHNGLYAQSSGELNTLVPIFFLAVPVRVPVPIAHSLIRARVDGNSGMVKVSGIVDVLRNGWVIKDGNAPVYIYWAGSRVDVEDPAIKSSKIGREYCEADEDTIENIKVFRGCGWKDFEEKIWPKWAKRLQSGENSSSNGRD